MNASGHTRQPANDALPADVAAEELLIGCLLVNSRRFHEVCRKISADDFFDDGCRAMWKAIEGLMTEGAVDQKGRNENYMLDAKPIFDRVRDNGEWHKISQSVEYYGRLVATGYDYVYYANRIAEMSIRRAMILANYESIGAMMAGNISPSQVIDTTMQTIAKVGAVQGSAAAIRSIGEVIRSEVVPRLEASVYGSERDESALPTGYPSIDRILGKLHRGGLIVLAGRTGQGKTSLATNIACNIAINQKKRVLFITLEQRQREIAEMVWRSAAKIGPLPDDASEDERKANMRELFATFDVVDNDRFLLCEAGGVTVEWIASLARARMATEPVDAIFIDYLGLIKRPPKISPVAYQIEHITSSLKILAKQLDVPIVLLCQVNRASEGTGTHNKQPEKPEPELRHLKDSSSIENDADAVLFVWHEDRADDTKIGYVKIAKNRHGPKGRVEMHFLGYCKRFIEQPISQPFDPSDWS